MADQVKLCPICGTINPGYQPECDACNTPLDDAEIVEIDDKGSIVPLTSTAVRVVLQNISLVTGDPAGQEIEVPAVDGEYVLGRSSDGYVPDLDAKPFTVPFVSQDKRDKNYGLNQRGISRSHVVFVRYQDRVGVYKHPQASLPVRINATDVIATSPDQVFELKDGDILELGEIFQPGSKNKAPGIRVRVAITA